MAGRAQLIAEQLACVRVQDLGCYDPARCWEIGHCAFSREDSRHMVTRQEPPRRSPRIKDPAAIKRKMRGERKCRCGCGRPATDGHHILPRSLGGDDVEQNICGLFHDCHMFLEFGAREGRDMRDLVGENLRDDEIAYVLDKLAGRAFGLDEREQDPAFGAVDDKDGPGWDFLARYYGVERRPIERRTT